MTEQLYKIEKRPAKCGEAIVDVFNGTFPTSRTSYTCDVLVPVPAPHTLAWAMGEMRANPMKEYIRSESSIRWRYNHDSRALEMFIFGGWTMHVIINDLDLELPWSPCEAEESKPVPQPGSYSEAYAAVLAGKVAIGSNGWRYWGYRESDKACSAACLDGGDVRIINWPHPRSGDWLPGGWIIEAPKPAIVPGSRNWLHSLDDGTRVRHTTYLPEWAATKLGDKVIAGWWNDGDMPIRIDDCADMGWSLAPEPNPVPGTLEWARDVVKGGGAVWKGEPLIKWVASGVQHAEFKLVYPAGNETFGDAGGDPQPFHLWGTREWLSSLPDGTRVTHLNYAPRSSATKRGDRVFANDWGDPDGVPISECGDSGWSLAPEEPTQPQAEPTLEQRVERLEQRADDAARIQENLTRRISSAEEQHRDLKRNVLPFVNAIREVRQ